MICQTFTQIILLISIASLRPIASNKPTMSDQTIHQDSNIISNNKNKKVNNEHRSYNPIGQVSPIIPLIELPKSIEELSFVEKQDLSKMLVEAMKTSGFLLVNTPEVPTSLQVKALAAAESFLSENCNKGDNDVVTRHPVDPKIYSMLNMRAQDIPSPKPPPILYGYDKSMENVKDLILSLLDICLDNISSKPSIAPLHSKNNNTLRLLLYPPVAKETGNRCKEHSDYGTLTLLLTDGISGLEIWHENKWQPVPYVPGTLVVNIGTWLSRYTDGKLKATLHRVAGPASSNSGTDAKILHEAMKKPRSSIAFFADPNIDAKMPNMQAEKIMNKITESNKKELNVGEYIEWRSGGSGSNRVGIAYTVEEERRALE